MILSHKYKYIFLKTNKTAGTSIEIALSKFCGNDDIITPISPEDEEIRKSLGYRGPQNYQLNGMGKNGFYNHISAREVKEVIDVDIWNNYFKFCFERNPWDRVISLYFWRCRSEPRPTIGEFLETDIPLVLKCKGYDLYTCNGHVLVDRVCHFELLSEELELVRTQLGIPEMLDLPRAKSKYRKDNRGYREILSKHEKEIIASLFSDEIELYGYKY